MCLQIKQAWDFAYQQLTAPSDPSESLLERIIRVDTVLLDRPRPQDPGVPEQLEEQVREEVYLRSEHHSTHKEHRSRKSSTRDRNRDRDRHRVSKHRSKRQHRERSAEYAYDGDEPAVAAVADEEEERGRRSSKQGDGRSRRSSDGDQHASHLRHRERSSKHRKSDRHRSSREVSPSDARRSKHIRFD